MAPCAGIARGSRDARILAEIEAIGVLVLPNRPAVVLVRSLRVDVIGRGALVKNKHTTGRDRPRMSDRSAAAERQREVAVPKIGSRPDRRMTAVCRLLYAIRV
jgi:hypothetical protein